MQAQVYGLYHMMNTEVFYNREDLWTVATEVGLGDNGEQTTLAMQPNFVLMKLPGETGEEFVEILPFTPANRNDPIGGISGEERWGELWDFGGLRLSQDEAGGWAVAAGGAHRPERAVVGAVDVVESAGGRMYSAEICW